MSLKNDIQELYYNLTVENTEQKKDRDRTLKTKTKTGPENFTKKEVSRAGNNKYHGEGSQTRTRAHCLQHGRTTAQDRFHE